MSRCELLQALKALLGGAAGEGYNCCKSQDDDIDRKQLQVDGQFAMKPERCLPKEQKVEMNHVVPEKGL